MSKITQPGNRVEFGPVNAAVFLCPHLCQHSQPLVRKKTSPCDHHTFTYLHRRIFPFHTTLRISPPRIGPQRLLYSHGICHFFLIPCSSFPVIHLKAVLQTGVTPGDYREIPMAKTSQQQISDPECSVVSTKPRSHSQYHSVLRKMASKPLFLQQSFSSG